MKKQNLKMLALFVMALVLILPSIALAESEEDTAGNALFDTSYQGGTVALDLYGTGATVEVSNASVGESAILAGKDITLSGTEIGSSLRAAGYSILATSTKIAANATVAGYSVTLGEGFQAKGVYAAASSVNFSGSCDAFSAFGETVILNGAVSGDAHIYAAHVIIGENAAVSGTLYVESSSEPAIPQSAKIAGYSFQQTESDDDSQTAETVSAGGWIVKSLKSLIMLIPGRILLAVLYFFVIGGTLKKSGSMLTTRTAPMLISGLIGLLALPVAAVVLLITYIGIPAGVLLLLLLGLTLGFAFSFTACSVAQLVFPKMHGLLASVIGVTVFSLVGIVPVHLGKYKLRYRAGCEAEGKAQC